MTLKVDSIVGSVAFSSDGERIVSGSHDNSVRIWSVSTGEEVKVLNGHTNFVISVAFSSDGMRIVSGSVDNSIRLWDASTGEEMKLVSSRLEIVVPRFLQQCAGKTIGIVGAGSAAGRFKLIKLSSGSLDMLLCSTWRAAHVTVLARAIPFRREVAAEAQ